MPSLPLTRNLKRLRLRFALIYTGSLIFLCGVAVTSNHILKEHAADQATSFIRRMVKLGDLRETIITLSQAKLDYFNGVVYFDRQGSKVFSLPVDLNPKIVNPSRTANTLRYGYIKSRIYFGGESSVQLGEILFIFDRYELVKYAVLLWGLLVLSTLPLISGAKKAVIKKYEEEMNLKSELARADLARKVRHDIRSPLVSLQGFLSANQNLTTLERRVLDRIVSRIFGIIADLEDQNERPSLNIETPKGPIGIEQILRDVIREKQLQPNMVAKINYCQDPSGFLAYSSLSPAKLSRVLSNLIDNALDATQKSGEIEISLRVALGTNVIRIEDSGKGIPPDILPKIFDKSFSYDKSSGSGIGLSSAKEVIEEAHGTIRAASVLGKGSVFEIQLPVGNHPPWWMDKINLEEATHVVVVDDQETSHDAWRLKFRGTRECEHLASASALTEWVSRHDISNTLFFVDFDLGPNSQNGIDLARSLKIIPHTVLVTGNFDDPMVQGLCSKLKLKLLPKPLIDTIAIV